MRRLLAAFAALFLLAAPAAQAQDAPEGGLFVNLTTDDTWAAAKAITFAHKRVLASGRDAAIWLNVRAVYLADTGRPAHIHGLMAESGTSIQDMLRAFIADGGRVIMCRVCSQAAGLTMEDCIEGVEMGSSPVIEAILFDPETKTLTW